jgi:hypothetical protein
MEPGGADVCGEVEMMDGPSVEELLEGPSMAEWVSRRIVGSPEWMDVEMVEMDVAILSNWMVVQEEGLQIGPLPHEE